MARVERGRSRPLPKPGGRRHHPVAVAHGGRHSLTRFELCGRRGDLGAMNGGGGFAGEPRLQARFARYRFRLASSVRMIA